MMVRTDHVGGGMEEQEIDIGGEVARVCRELVYFRDEFLPAIIDPGSPQGHLDKYAHPLHRWQWAADRLLDALPLSSTGEGRTAPERQDYEAFLFQPVSASSHAVREGRISWRIELFVDWDRAAGDVLSLAPGRADRSPDPMEELRLNLSGVRRRIMALPADGYFLWNLLCLSLAAIADLDPAFAKLALDGDAWRTIVLSDRGIDEETRGQRLKAVGGYFRHVVNNALLHVMGALACNHFEVLEDFLDHPDLVGRYTRLMPHYIFAVTFQKVIDLYSFIRSESNSE